MEDRKKRKLTHQIYRLLKKIYIVKNILLSWLHGINIMIWWHGYFDFCNFTVSQFFFLQFLIKLSMDIFYTNEQINMVEIITSKSPK